MKIFAEKYKPLKMVLFFNLLTIILFITAPYNWKTENLFIFLLLSTSSLFFIFLGYKIGLNKQETLKINTKILFFLSKKQTNFIFIFYFLTFLIRYAFILKFKPYEIIEMINLLSIGFYDPQLGYKISLDTYKVSSIPWFVYFIISVFNQIFFIVGFLNWKRINNFLRFSFLVFVVFELFFWMGRGTNFGVITMISTFIFAYLCNSINLKKNKTQTLKNNILITCLIFLGISIFSSNMISRSGNSDLDYKIFNIGESDVNENSLILDIIPEKFHQTYFYIVSYMTQGYYHTCLAFDLEYKPTYLLSSNPTIIEFVKLLGISTYEDSYVYRLKNVGVDPNVNWHSSYTWYASDFTFFGLPLFFLLNGVMFGYCWRLIYNHGDFLSKIIFVIFGNSMIYIFANNNYLNSVFYSVIIFLPIWFFTRFKNIKN